MKNRFIYPAVFSALTGFFLLTFSSNHSEAEDCFFYARMAEQGAWPGLFHAHHLLYLPLMRGVLRLAQFAGYDGRSFSVLAGVSMISGATAVCLFSALLQRMNVKKQFAWLFAGALLVSYGFWRYSTTVEIYLPAAVLSLLAMYCAARGGEKRFFWIGILSGGASLLIHLVTAPAVLAAVPVLYLFRRLRVQALLHLVTVLLIAGAGYGVVIGCGIRPEIFSDAMVQRGTLLQPLTWVAALAAWGQTICSGNFLFSIPASAEQIVRLLPSQMLQEELFMGRHAPKWVSIVAPLTCGLAVGLSAGALYFVLRNLKRVLTGWSAEFTAVFVWVSGAAALAVLFEPANPEMWICVLPPLWLFAGQIWNTLPNSRMARGLPAVLAAVLLAHNWIGGMSLVKRPEGDYCRQKSSWIIGQARQGDLILSADSHSFTTFLAYQTSASIADAKFINLAQWTALKSGAPTRIFVFSDVINPLPAVLHRAPPAVQSLEEVAVRLQPGLKPVHQDQFGAVYQWMEL